MSRPDESPSVGSRPADLGEHLEDFVSGLVEAGRYASRDHVLRDGVRLVEDRERRSGEIDAAIRRGLADADAGRVKPIDEVHGRLLAKYQALIDRS